MTGQDRTAAQGHERILAVGNETFSAEGGRAGTSSAACTCGERNAERYPDATDRVIVPSAADCPIHGVSAAQERRDCASATPHEAHEWTWDGGLMWCEGKPSAATVEERLDRIERAIHALAWWLVQTQSGFGQHDAEGIDAYLRGERE